MRAGNRWEFIILSPVEISAIDNRTANRNTMPANPFGEGMNDDIGTKRNWFPKAKAY